MTTRAIKLRSAIVAELQRQHKADGMFGIHYLSIDQDEHAAVVDAEKFDLEALANALDAALVDPDDTFVDEAGTTWERPTAFAYQRVCAALHKKTGLLRECYQALENPTPRLRTLLRRKIKEVLG